VTPLERWLAEDLVAQGLAESDFRLIVRQGGEPEAFRQGARDLLRERVAVIWTSTTAPALAAKAETSTVPIVFGVAEDADQVGLVDRLGRPGGNVTGVSVQRGVLVGKRLELLKELRPRVRRVLITLDPESVVTPSLLQEARAAARQLGLVLVEVSLATRADVEQLPALIKREGVDAVCHVVNAAVNAQPQLVVAAIDHARLPDIAYYLPAVEEGWSLAAYAPSHRAAWRASARQLARILRGAKPSELPVESPDIFELHVSMHVARQRGISVPQPILTRAHNVLE
jgi:putative ABC transport system substrate-binding protein